MGIKSSVDIIIILHQIIVPSFVPLSIFYFLNILLTVTEGRMSSYIVFDKEDKVSKKVK